MARRNSGKHKTDARWMCETCEQESYLHHQPEPVKWSDDHICNFIPIPQIREEVRWIEITPSDGTSAFDCPLREWLHPNYTLDLWSMQKDKWYQPILTEGQVQAIFMLSEGQFIDIGGTRIKRIQMKELNYVR
tara:strand:- start:393 stop:791 length:399 start_codon:yes stop_codon:yes gene_type:complete